jgi:hypothetical protein
MGDIVFLGAGASQEFEVPLAREMAVKFRDSLRPATSHDYQDSALCDRIFDQLREYPDFDIEALITVLEHIRDPSMTTEGVLAHPAVRYFPVLAARWDMVRRSVIDQSSREMEPADRLLGKIKDFVITTCAVQVSPSDDRLSILDRFFKTIFRGTLDFAVMRQSNSPCDASLDLFSTNYDRIIETYCYYCNWASNNGEGEVRVGRPRPRAGELNFSDLVIIQRGCRIYKLHGTINWYVDEDTGRPMFAPSIPQVGQRDLYGSKVRENMLIFPIREWHTYREPYYPLFDALRAKLLSSRCCFVVGYSFRDKDILELILDAADLNKNLTFCLVDPAAEEITHGKLAKYEDRVFRVPYGLSEARTPEMIQDYQQQH